jgi:quinoprotein glucose dehydrogenase
MKRSLTALILIALATPLLFSLQTRKPSVIDYSKWEEYLGGPDRSHYSSLLQINTRNVSKIRKVWEYKSGDSGQVQCNPIIVDGVLYGVTATNQVFALDAATGLQKWKYVQPGKTTSNTNRGVTYWEDGADKRILYGYDAYLNALDAKTGQPLESFGNNGKASLKAGLDASAKDRFVISNTPGTLFEDLIIMPLRVGEDPGSAIGYIQAFNVRTGKLAWVFKTIPDRGEPGARTWPADVKEKQEVGGANSWAGMSIDREREIVYIPTGSAAFDFYGANRLGENLFANCLVALNARTGKLVWHYQLVHHDLWDRDLPAPPNLLRVKRNGKFVDAVAQVTKNGFVFMFDRVTGTPLFPIDEKPVPKSVLPGEQAWPTQPVPRLPAPFSRQNITEKDISHFAENRQELLNTFKNAKKGAYQPLSLTPTILFPGADGGAEWGGAAVDPEGILYINSNEIPWLFSLSESKDNKKLSGGHLVYSENCSTCHGTELKGNPASGFPSLVNIKSRLSRKEIRNIITSGKGMMPGFSQLSTIQKQRIVDFLLNEEKKEAPAASSDHNAARPAMPYKFNGYDKFLDNRGYPAITPPWGTLTAIDMNTGKHLWKRVLGEFKELSDKGIPATGTENYGGPVVTAGGLIFIAATKDGMFRAFEKTTGRLLWETQLPAAGYATPSTYEIDGRQYVVIACGGGKLGTKKGDSYLAFAL